MGQRYSANKQEKLKEQVSQHVAASVEDGTLEDASQDKQDSAAATTSPEKAEYAESKELTKSPYTRHNTAVASLSEIKGPTVSSDAGSLGSYDPFSRTVRTEHRLLVIGDDEGEEAGGYYREKVYTAAPQIAMPELMAPRDREEGAIQTDERARITLNELPPDMDVEIKAQLIAQQPPTALPNAVNPDETIKPWMRGKSGRGWRARPPPKDGGQGNSLYEPAPVGTYDSDTEDPVERVPDVWETAGGEPSCCHKCALCCCCCCCVQPDINIVSPEGIDPRVAFEKHVQASRNMEYAPPEWFYKFRELVSASRTHINEYGGDELTEDNDLVIRDSDPDVLYYTGDIVDHHRGRNLYFRDGKRRIDYVLAWSTSNKDPEKAAEWDKTRQVFERNLEEEGLDIEEDVDETGEREKQFTKIHAPFMVLCRYAEIMKNRMPIKEVPEEVKAQNIWEMMAGYMSKLFSPFELNPIKVPPMPKKFTHVFERDKSYLFAIPPKKEQFFSHASRNRIVDYILRRKRYSDDIDATFSFGIKRLLSNGTYTAAYPLHEGSWKPYTRLSMRRLLYENWGMWQNWFKFQPLDYIRVYFGEKIGIYFAWLGYYTYMLIAPSIIGLVVFIYGCATINQNIVADEVCKGDFTMCPLCDLRCPFWNYSALCSQYRATHIFDNAGTVFFAFFMSLWGTLFLEFWKREEAGIQFKWNLMNFEEEEEPPRPEYLARLANSRFKKKHKVTGVEEPFLPFWRRKFPVYFCSVTTVLFLCLVAIAVMVGIIVYRMSVQSALYLSNNQLIYSNAGMVTSASAAAINLVVIFILNFVYGKLAVILTDWECWRTQSEYDNSLTFKLYFMQFVNYYSSIFYIAFFKGTFAGRPGDYNTFFGARQQECQGGCLTELCIQLAIIFVGKQLIQNNLTEIFLPRVKKWALQCFCASDDDKKPKAPWEKDLELEPLGQRGLFNEYLEMLIQFGFVTLFVAAFPLAPLFALLNNIIEIRADANKFVTQYRRPMAARAANIGVWYSILYGVSRLAILTNAFIIALTSNFIAREVYTRGGYSPDGSLRGFVNNSLSFFNVSDLAANTQPVEPGPGFNGTELCRFNDHREPPWNEPPYGYTTQYWHIVAAQFIFVVVFENLVVVITSLLAYAIPDMPQKLKEQVRREAFLTNGIILKTELEIARGEDGVLDEEQMTRIRRRARLSHDTPPAAAAAAAAAEPAPRPGLRRADTVAV